MGLIGRKYNNMYYSVMYFAPPGVGKSVFLQKKIHEHLKKGWKVYTTDENLDGIHISSKLLGHYRFDKRCRNLLVIDEASTIFHSRNYKSFGSELINFFKLHRHQHVRIIMASQSYNDVDKVIRILCTKYYLLSRWFSVFVVARKIRKEIALTEAIGEQGGSIAEQYIYEPIFSSGAVEFAFLPHWVKTFDSFADEACEGLPLIDTVPDVAEQIGGFDV